MLLVILFFSFLVVRLIASNFAAEELTTWLSATGDSQNVHNVFGCPRLVQGIGTSCH